MVGQRIVMLDQRMVGQKKPMAELREMPGWWSCRQARAGR
jgi:hypothetical protein